MGKIDEKNQFEVTKNSIAQILDAYNISDFLYEELKQGIENTTLLIQTEGKKLVLRIYRREKKSNEDIQLEIHFQKYLHARNFPLPELIQNEKGEFLTLTKIKDIDWQAVLMQYMGKTDFTSYTDALIKDLASTQAKMHIAGIDFAKTIPNHKVYAELRETMMDNHPIPGLDRDKKDFIERAKKFYLSFTPTLPFGYNHLDFDTHGNVLTKNDKVLAVLDFDDLFYSPPVLCLGYTLWHVLFETKDVDRVKNYISEYQQIRELTQEELKVLPQIILFRNYVIGAIELGVRESNEYIDYIIQLESKIEQLNFTA